MRKAQKKQAEDFIKLLYQAHDEIKKAIEAEHISAASELLVQCQEGAVRLGELIEKTEGEGFPTISLLESYCETVYRIYDDVVNGRTAGANQAYKNLRKSLIQIENSVKNEIKIRLEAVFLPYKASMWDSLESVWKAAEDDPDCDAYVVPIPYYDKDPDGSFREEHYEGGQYPPDVPITPYRYYDFAKRRPDMIFIHNPYDDCNFVTSVHPDFYAANLKRYTDRLIYIPYFILREMRPCDKERIEGIRHFCTLPGVIYADRVIVQSEDMRKVYIKLMMEFTGKHGSDRKYWEDKILGLGSPKVDKVCSTSREELQIPEAWLRVVQKPDGSRKKIILYNSSVSALLKYSERMLDKMREVFAVFRENQEEIALLWRPHPLIRATIECMRPQLWSEYDKLVQKYREENWGIYDDSTDMHRAIALSDAYYGDPSSLVQLYEKTGKPIMMQSVETISYETVDDL